MSDITVSNDVDTLLQSSNQESIRTNVGLGASDTVEFGGVILPAGTTAEINAVTNATVGQLMVNTDTNSLMRFVSASEASKMDTVPADNISLTRPEADQGLQDFLNQPQKWAMGGIDITNGDDLATAVPLRLTESGKFEVSIMLNRSIGQSGGHANSRVIYNITGGGNIYSIAVNKSNVTTGQTGFFRTRTTNNNLAVDVYNSFLSWANVTGTYSEEIILFIDNPANTTTTITFNSIVTNQYFEPITVETVTIAKVA